MLHLKSQIRSVSASGWKQERYVRKVPQKPIIYRHMKGCLCGACKRLKDKDFPVYYHAPLKPIYNLDNYRVLDQAEGTEDAPPSIPGASVDIVDPRIPDESNPGASEDTQPSIPVIN